MQPQPNPTPNAGRVPFNHTSWFERICVQVAHACGWLNFLDQELLRNFSESTRSYPTFASMHSELLQLREDNRLMRQEVCRAIESLGSESCGATQDEDAKSLHYESMFADLRKALSDPKEILSSLGEALRKVEATAAKERPQRVKRPQHLKQRMAVKKSTGVDKVESKSESSISVDENEFGFSLGTRLSGTVVDVSPERVTLQFADGRKGVVLVRRKNGAFGPVTGSFAVGEELNCRLDCKITPYRDREDDSNKPLAVLTVETEYVVVIGQNETGPPAVHSDGENTLNMLEESTKKRSQLGRQPHLN